MNSYSHLVLANHVEPLLQPEDRGAYYWGAVAPDIRYLSEMRREQTHLPQEGIAAWLRAYPRLKSFLQGYAVHCALDQIDLTRVIGRKFPLGFLRARLSQQRAAVLIEYYYLEKRPVTLPLDGECNEVLARLGISEAMARRFAASMREYFATRSLETALETFRRLGMVKNQRIESYIRAARSVQKNRLLKEILFLGVRSAGLEELARDQALSLRW